MSYTLNMAGEEYRDYRDGEGYIYIITNIYTDAVYVGSTTQRPGARWARHRSFLRHGQHHSRSLQHDWNHYGPEAFEFKLARVIEEIDSPMLAHSEQAVLDWFRSSGRPVYNATKHIVTSPYALTLPLSLGAGRQREYTQHSLLGIAQTLSTRLGYRVTVSKMLQMIADGELDVTPR